MFNDASILVTGGTGSFGQCCVKTLLERWSPRRVIVFSRDELKQHKMQSEIDHEAIRFFLGDIRDEVRLRQAFREVDYVIHAAALKQVPALEYNPGEAVKTNIIGAMNIINAAQFAGVKSVIALSTDKACTPVNLYGATKLASDKLFVASNSLSGKDGTIFSVVRYGNVFGSRGSVVPLFSRLIDENSDSLPITDERMTRFFIPLEQGIDFVLKSFQRMWGAEIFVPKLPSCKIVDLAKAMAPELAANTVGIRPGEKIHETLIPLELSRSTIEFDDFFIVAPEYTHHIGVDYLTTRLDETGTRVADGFEYRSDTNPDILSIEQLKEFVANYSS